MTDKSGEGSVVPGRKSLSVKDLLERPNNYKTTCSASSRGSVLPCISQTRTRGRGKKVCDRGKAPESNEIEWLRPGISLPKMRGKEKLPEVQITPVQSPTSLSTRKDSSALQDSLSHSSASSLGGCFLRNRVKSEDLAVNVVGPSECQPSFEVASSDLRYNISFMDDTQVEESKALRNWEKWMTRRKKVNANLVGKLNRGKCQLLMNSAENLRQIKEEKDMLSYAKLPSGATLELLNMYRERPRLAVKSDNTYYYAHETLYEQGIMPPLEFIDVPNKIREEKDIYCSEESTSRNRNAWVDSEYRKEQVARFSRKLSKMKHKDVDLKDLIVVGEKIPPASMDVSDTVYDVPRIEITPPPDEAIHYQMENEHDREVEDIPPCFSSIDHCFFNESVAALVINGVEIIYKEDDGYPRNMIRCEDPDTWSIIFHANPIGSIAEKALHVENRGTVAIRYSWVPVFPDPKIPTFPVRKCETSIRCFYFNKNPGIFLPGQKYRIPFYHYAKYPGYHTETWHLSLKPNVFRDADYGRIRLVAVSENVDGLADFQKIDAYLDTCVRDSVTKKIMDEIFERVRPQVPRQLEYQSLFTEEELFEFQNPFHYYRHEAVDELRSLFSEIPQDTETGWDLNLLTLEDLILTRNEGKTQHKMLCKLMELSRLLLKPGRETYKTDRKRTMVYNALCNTMDIIDKKAATILQTFYNTGRCIVESGTVDKGSSDQYDTSTTSCSDSSDQSASYSVSAGNASDTIISSQPSPTPSFYLNSSDLALYRNALYTMVYNSLGDAAEHAAGIIEACKLFEHHGEIVPSSALYTESVSSTENIYKCD